MFDYPKYDNNDDDDTAPHCIKFSLIEDEYIKRWQECVKFCCWITAAESRVGDTLYSMAVTHGKLILYKLYAWTYGGKHDDDGDIQDWHKHTQNEAKFVNRFDIMPSSFHRKGHHVTCDSAYIMGDNMAQISWKTWKINMVRTIQAN